MQAISSYMFGVYLITNVYSCKETHQLQSASQYCQDSKKTDDNTCFVVRQLHPVQLHFQQNVSLLQIFQFNVPVAQKTTVMLSFGTTPRTECNHCAVYSLEWTRVQDHFDKFFFQG